METGKVPLLHPAKGLPTPKKARLIDLGFVKDYDEVWNLQKDLLSKRIEGKIPDTLILVEHDHVITLGRSSHLENVLLKELPTFEIERGGDVTYHGPGQLVGYPILSLSERGLGVRQYVELLESSIVRTLASVGIERAEGKLGKETGVWVAEGRRKIASIGVAVSHWVTYHGFALNVSTDLSYFQKIRPCGFDANVMTSISRELNVEDYNLAQVKSRIANNLASEFSWDFSA